jgi:hypothetical protein
MGAGEKSSRGKSRRASRRRQLMGAEIGAGGTAPTMIQEIMFALDSPLEEAGFEPSVPGQTRPQARCGDHGRGDRGGAGCRGPEPLHQMI